MAILGGGLGAMTAAFELTEQPNWRDSYELTVYQIGWRLGGKGASGRNPRLGYRIEEHGIHVFFGFYENTFSLLRRCYAALKRPQRAPLGSWRQAFKRHDEVIWAEEQPERGWGFWPVRFPRRPGARDPGGRALHRHQPQAVPRHLQ